MKKTKRFLSNLLFLLNAYLRHSKLVALGGIAEALIFTPVRNFIMATVAQAVIKSAQDTHAFMPALLTAAKYFAVFYAVTLGYWIWIDFYVRWKSNEISAKLEREIYDHAIKVDLRHMDDPQYYKAFKLATEEFVSRSGNLYSEITELLGQVFSIAAMVAVLASSGPFIVLLVVVTALIEMGTRIYWNEQSAKRSKQQINPRRRRNYVQRLMFNTSAAGDVRSTGIMRFLMRSYDDGINEQTRVIKSFSMKEFIVDIVQTFSQNLTTFIIVLYVAYGFASGKVTDIGVFATLLSASQILSSNLMSLSWQFTSIHEIAVFGEQAREFFDVEPGIEYSTDGEPAPDGQFELELRNVNFTYPGSSFSLKNLSLKVGRGEKIAIVGENGAGKTTLSKLLLRLYDINGGEILLNGKALTDYNVHSLRQRIGVAFQEPQIYALTVRENMQTHSNTDDETLTELLKLVGLDIELDSDLTREFAENGVMLSGGQAQKLGLTRILHGEYGLLLLDEPSSALDPLAEYELTKILFDKANANTTIMVAHRLSTIRDADRIYLVSDGEIAEVGTHTELMELNGRYCEMFTKQAEKYVNSALTVE
ncbi:MAG: ABC transporter ATP-binding protein/permease [Oscillospiraceae bacterium]|nr:ABC transporter ATP-binding protein/permease [Oscillospiraceae bacterium]